MPSSPASRMWHRHDMPSFARLYAPDADFVNVIGQWLRGRAAIETQHVLLHAMRMKTVT